MLLLRLFGGANIHEHLFVGDVASEAEHLTLQSSRSRPVDDFMVGSDRQAVLLIAALHRIPAAEPTLTIVQGHDSIAVAAFERAGLVDPEVRYVFRSAFTRTGFPEYP